ncbi:type II secretion system protein GspM [Telmatospirillum sp.]|uniref:type II secretion system protein GspM n=1 Tax=Telmatospirillum sp. TaxID=2079197 RepID=UPI00284AD455|nr:type II secretion system protein GspM [Telmatospirillum sp.]MDR3436837.1 type II secretion system protein GspM [Telmatospirillum sp.]
MTSALPTGRPGQLIAVLLLGLVLAVVWRIVASPLLDFYGTRSAELEQRALLVSHLEALAEALPRLKANPAIEAPPAVLTLEGATDSVAAATLQEMVQDMAAAAGGTLGSVENLPGEPAGGLRRIGLRVAASGGMDSVFGLLASIEQSATPVLIDDLQIHANFLPSMGTGPQAPAKDLRLDASFAVYGYRLDHPEGRRP